MAELPLALQKRGTSVRLTPEVAGGAWSMTMLTPARLATILLLVITATLGYASIAVVRPFFVLVAAVVGFLAWREGVARSVEVSIVLFSTAPFLRRVVDFGIGYDPSGYMLLGPLLAILIPTYELRRFVAPNARMNGTILPFILVSLCVSYGIALSAFKGDMMPAASAAVKAFAPLLYGVWIAQKPEQSQAVIAAAARAFMIAMLIAGLYGIFQYIDPPPWDRYWMFQSQMDSIGSPEPYAVRVFSTLNSPASFAAYTVCALLLLGFCRSGWQAALVALPIAVGLLLSASRTHWIALVIGVLYCSIFAKTRLRALFLGLLLGLSILVTALATPEIADSVLQRLDTLSGSVSQDGSGAARLDQFSEIYTVLDDLVLGAGIAGGNESLRAGMVLDGEVVSAIVRLGLVVGTIYLASLIWAVLSGLSRIGFDSEPQMVVAGAVLSGALAQIPLVGITNGETGFLFWLFLGIAVAGSPIAASR